MVWVGCSQVCSLYRRSLAVELLAPQLRFERCQLSLDVLCGFALADDFLAITAQEIIDGFHANADRARRLVLVEILEAEVGRTRLLDDAFDHAVDRRVVSALEAGDFERDQIRDAEP